MSGVAVRHRCVYDQINGAQRAIVEQSSVRGGYQPGNAARPLKAQLGLVNGTGRTFNKRSINTTVIARYIGTVGKAQQRFMNQSRALVGKG
jgi:hypothetical protein